MAAALSSSSSSSSGSSAHAEEPISYIQRKTQQRSSRDGSWIQNQGIDYSTTEQLVSELFALIFISINTSKKSPPLF